MADRVLVIDDDSELCELVAEYLGPEGFETEAVHDGLTGVDRATAGHHAAVVLDVMLPALGGFEVLRRIRSVSAVPVIMLTARGDDLDRIMGLEIGADDYLPKPFNPRELVARIRAVLRRSRAAQAPADDPREKLAVDDVVVDLAARVVKREGAAVDLTAAEYEVLIVLLRAAGTVVSREGLVKTAFGKRLGPYDRAIDMHLSNMRRKLGPHADGSERIKTVRGVGYVYARQAA